MARALFIACALALAGCGADHWIGEVKTQPLEPAPDSGPVVGTSGDAGAGDGGSGDAGCTADKECPAGTVCEGCSTTSRACIAGCRTDADCGGKKCNPVQCFTCPCADQCG